MFVDGDVGSGSLNPTAGVEIFYAVLYQPHGQVRVAAEDALRLLRPRVGNRPGRNLGRMAPPARIEPVHELGEALASRVQLL